MQNIRVLDTGLDITPVGDRSGTHFALHNLKNVLPNIIVNVYPLNSNFPYFTTISISLTAGIHSVVLL